MCIEGGGDITPRQIQPLVYDPEKIDPDMFTGEPGEVYSPTLRDRIKEAVHNAADTITRFEVDSVECEILDAILPIIEEGCKGPTAAQVSMLLADAHAEYSRWYWQVYVPLVEEGRKIEYKTFEQWLEEKR
jgi:hypothetical protein